MVHIRCIICFRSVFGRRIGLISLVLSHIWGGEQEPRPDDHHHLMTPPPATPHKRTRRPPIPELHLANYHNIRTTLSDIATAAEQHCLNISRQHGLAYGGWNPPTLSFEAQPAAYSPSPLSLSLSSTPAPQSPLLPPSPSPRPPLVNATSTSSIPVDEEPLPIAPPQPASVATIHSPPSAEEPQPTSPKTYAARHSPARPPPSAPGPAKTTPFNNERQAHPCPASEPRAHCCAAER
ncbi:hypothetical protein RSOL_052530 [Rhizoctonia solani AG-3 Rhs1AP]|uniref:Transmembrane protein n=2 Tax=Rhizoctonia solani AG-3 TaxID=1086053 RepID=A0A074RTD4_9AGAM|nr:hypothetical protein RSOL_052530 [Rhizoctonia solani AG-3 Rhs1AP]KEP47928.1 hypothetical protein V565_139160 [Rhizoctonia solani 123E]